MSQAAMNEESVSVSASAELLEQNQERSAGSDGGYDVTSTSESEREDSSSSSNNNNNKETKSDGEPRVKSSKHHHRHRHRPRSTYKSRSEARKGGSPRSSMTLVEKMLDRFKKKDKLCSTAAVAGGEEEEDEVRRLPPINVKSAEDFPKDLKKLLRAAKLAEADLAANFLILLNCLHFLTKRSFVFTPPDGSESITIGRIKHKEREPKWATLPSQETLLSEAVVKKEVKVQEVVGEGGFGRVYMAKNLKGKGRVAVKKMKHIRPRDQFRNLSEIFFLKRVDHPNIVKYLSAYTVNDELWIVTEFMEGGTLSQALKCFEFQEKQIAFVAKEMLQGIYYLHQNQLIHRDLKSSNIMMTTYGDVKLIDFGLCMDYKVQGGRRCHMVGSPFWMPPEMIKKESYSYPVDIWSFAICLLELANGQPPNRKSSLRAMFIAGTEGYPRPFKNPAQWTKDFKQFIAVCLETDPEKRATAHELLQHPFLAKADTRKGMKKILSHIFLQNTMEMMNLGGI